MTSLGVQLNDETGQVPVCLWFYTRADNVREILSRVAVYRPRRLYLVSDGAKPGDEPLVREARQAAEKGVTWPCEVSRNYADENLGAKRRIVSGIDWVFQQEEEAIFLEDDTIPDPSFFLFCEVMLDYYRSDARIMLIGGSNPLSGRVTCSGGYIFSRYFQIWGWATWKRVWRLYDTAISRWPEFKEAKALNAFYNHAGMRAWISAVFDGVHAGRIDTWDAQLFFACLFNNGLAVVPGKNLVTNVGYDGLHVSPKDIGPNLGIPTEAIDVKTLVHPRYVHPSFMYDDLFMRQNFTPPKRSETKMTLGVLLKRIVGAITQ
jgi:hypothetical protein